MNNKPNISDFYQVFYYWVTSSLKTETRYFTHPNYKSPFYFLIFLVFLIFVQTSVISPLEDVAYLLGLEEQELRNVLTHRTILDKAQRGAVMSIPLTAESARENRDALAKVAYREKAGKCADCWEGCLCGRLQGEREGEKIICVRGGINSNSL
jgi:hypothetical protein